MAASGEAITCRTSNIRYSPVTTGSGPSLASASTVAIWPIVNGCPDAML
jgi:hypothetical protein